MASFLDDREAVVKKIIVYTGKARADIEKLMEAKKEKFAGLLTEAGAAFLVAKELGVDLEFEKNIATRLKLGQLEEGMNNVDLEVGVKQVFQPKKFEKGEKKGRLCNLLVADDSGEMRLTVWHNDVKKLEDEKIERGAALLLKNCYVTAFNDKKQLNLGYNGQMIVLSEPTAGLPGQAREAVKLGELKPGLNDVDVVARVARVYEARDFESAGRKGSLQGLELVDGSGRVRATAWNDLVEEAGKLVPGSLIKIEGAYTKEGMKGTELHLGWQARIIVEPKKHSLPFLEELGGQTVAKKKLNELVEGSGTVQVTGKIVGVYKGNLAYNTCLKCGKKVEEDGDAYRCAACGESREADLNAVIGVGLDDGTAEVRLVAFGDKAEKLMGWNKAELRKRLQTTMAEKLVEELKQQLTGKEVSAVGRAKENQNTRETEFIAWEIAFKETQAV
ncbi:MAG: hypothetical protein J4203_01920 [Candidatus Diapherotrites archaeon]|uniref:Replication factor A C-terminal domain-containing protein n=1 Tax=Candidatus Iainarchaeum sp. TaxID=3101447 RepID=A0A8T4L7N5_9ARCH|nr:hypothetical protein [Candidatus Diapherotrites archaeon]